MRLILRHRLLAGNLIFRPAACADGQIISGSFTFLRVLFLLFGFFRGARLLIVFSCRWRKNFAVN
jgi:hypothetical protein